MHFLLLIIQAQFELVGRSLLEKQTKLQNLQKRFEVEQDLVELESTLGCQVSTYEMAISFE